MNRTLRFATFFAGLLVPGWVALGYVGSNPLALIITVMIAAFYLMGAWELHRFGQATAALERSVAALPDPLPGLHPWLATLPASLRNAVRRRVEGEHIGLPGPSLAPYLAGLLVLLGMLGTFLGMVLTLRGTGLALDSATDLQSVRTSLVAPVKGLGLAFGTSVAGVATSAALGLLSALARRERVQAAQQLEACIATTLRVFTPVHQREESMKLMQRQAELMPVLVDSLRAMTAAMALQAQDTHAGLLASQEGFHSRAELAFAGLASSVGRSLNESLAEGARLAGATIAPAIETTMAAVAHETHALTASLGATAQRQLDELAAALLHSVEQAHGELQSSSASREEQRMAALARSIEAMTASLRHEWQQAGEQNLGRQQRLCETMERTARDIGVQSEAHARSTVAEIARLLETASEAPRAAAEVIAELRHKFSDSLVRDNAVLDERAHILETMTTLLDTVNRSATEQRGAIDALVASSESLLARVGTRFGEQVDAQAGRLADAAAQVNAGAVEVASLGEAFGFAVQRFGQSNDKLVAQLQRIDGALTKSLTRSDEQLAYYVAQAREVIDLSMLSQRQIIEDLQRVSGPAASAKAAA